MASRLDHIARTDIILWAHSI